MFFSSVKEKYRLINNKTFSKLRFSKFKKFVSRLVLEGSNSRRYHWIRSSRPEVCCKKGALKNFAKFTGKHLCRISFLKKRLWHSCFPVNFAKFLRPPFFKEHFWWLLYSNFETSCWNLKIRGLGAKLWLAFLLF